MNPSRYALGRSQSRGGVDRPIPAALIAGDEGGGARKLQGVKRYLLEGLGRGGGGRRRLVDGEQRRSAYGIGGEVAPGVEGGRGMARELRESEAELLVGSAWAEEVWRAVATVSSSSPACGRTAAVFWGVWVGNWRGCEGNALPECSWC